MIQDISIETRFVIGNADFQARPENRKNSDRRHRAQWADRPILNLLTSKAIPRKNSLENSADQIAD
jgi:hypothetical protein